MTNPISIQASIFAAIEKTWNAYINPEEIKLWNHASEDWHCPNASVDFRVGGHFNATMAAKDGSASFDFIGHYQEIVPNELIRYTIDGDDRKVEVLFSEENGITNVQINFESENENSRELQESGWQSILNNFKSYTESL